MHFKSTPREYYLRHVYLFKLILRNDFVQGERITIERIVLIRKQVSRDRLSVHDLKDHKAPSNQT